MLKRPPFPEDEPPLPTPMPEEHSHPTDLDHVYMLFERIPLRERLRRS